MNCSDWEERIALHAGGDLPPAEAAEVEQHLRECAGCQVLSSGLKQSLALLREAHDEPLAPAHFSAVRARVVAELEKRRRPLWRRAWAYGLATGVVVLLVMLALRSAPTPQTPVLAVNHPPAPREMPVAQVLPKPVHVAHKRAPLPARPVESASAGRADTLMVKLVTDDPNIVIYWIAAKKGD